VALLERSVHVLYGLDSVPMEITFDTLKLVLGVFQQTHRLPDLPTTLRRRTSCGYAGSRRG
jgi:hypothetical protein